jgi:hypothetical protein
MLDISSTHREPVVAGLRVGLTRASEKMSNIPSAIHVRNVHSKSIPPKIATHSRVKRLTRAVGGVRSTLLVQLRNLDHHNVPPYLRDSLRVLAGRG